MSYEIVFFGIQMPTLLIVFTTSSILYLLCDIAMSNFGIYKYIWHSGLFRVAMFICIFTLPCLIIY